eukprot:COSAG01_NODE_29309_length_640_cov_2.641405_1_plen_178_part_01
MDEKKASPPIWNRRIEFLSAGASTQGPEASFRPDTAYSARTRRTRPAMQTNSRQTAAHAAASSRCRAAAWPPGCCCLPQRLSAARDGLGHCDAGAHCGRRRALAASAPPHQQRLLRGACSHPQGRPNGCSPTLTPCTRHKTPYYWLRRPLNNQLLRPAKQGSSKEGAEEQRSCPLCRN